MLALGRFWPTKCTPLAVGPGRPSCWCTALVAVRRYCVGLVAVIRFCGNIHEPLVAFLKGEIIPGRGVVLNIGH